MRRVFDKAPPPHVKKIHTTNLTATSEETILQVVA